VKPHFNAQAMRKIGQLALAGCLMLTAAEGHGQAEALPGLAAASGAPAAKAKQRYTMVGYDRSIKQQDFAGLGKPTVLRMQQQLEVIYRDLADWQHDFALRAHPLNDGIVGPITLSWLQRYAFNFKFTSGAEVGKDFPAHMERMAAFAVAHPSELAILLDKQFEEWDGAKPAPVKAQDFAVRRQADEAALLELVNRYRASRTAPPPARPEPVDSDGYYSYVLHPEDLEVLGGKAEIGAILAKFKDKPYASKEALKVALEQALKGRAYVLDKVWPVIDKSVRPFDGYLINAANRATLKKAGMADSTLDELAAFGTVYLKSRDAFDTYVADKIAAGELTIADDALVQLVDTTKVFDNYHLDQQALDTVEKQLSGSVHYVGLPGAVVKMLEQIKEVDYPDAEIYNSAAKSKIAFGLGMCKLNTPVNNSYMASLAISNDELASLQKDLEALRPSPADGHAVPASELGAQFQDISALRNLTERCSEDEKKKANGIVTRLYDTYLRTAIDSAGRKKMPAEIRPIQIKGGDCGCALDDLAGVVYGFYPYWWEQKGRQTVNFRALNRMAYYGLTVDDTGEFYLGSNSFDIHDGSAGANEFVRIARQYNSKVDWLIQKNDWGGEWKTLSSQGRRAVFKRMLNNITALLNAPLSDPGAKVKSWTAFAGATPPRRGDGVTLYFPNYPDDKESTAQFNEFYLALRAEMDRDDLWLNILVSQNTLATGKNGTGGAFGLANLVNLRKLRGVTEQHVRPGVHDNDEYLLVLLNEPSSEAKKALRLDLENDSMLHGADRADFLRSILPILHFDDHNWQQLDDDIVYARDNFGGVGFWAPDFDNLAQPAAKDANQSCLQSKQIAVCLLKNYRDESVNDSLPGPVEVFACVHRWVLQLMMLFLLAAGIVVIVLFFTFCKVQNFIKNYFLWVQLLIPVPALLIFILLLLYDPFMLSLSHGNLPFFISAGIIMVGIGVGYRFWRAQRQVPQRERGMPQRQGTGFPIVVWKIESDKGGFQWLIKNRGSGYAIIKKVEILLDGSPVADAKTALESVMESDNNVLWKSVPLVGQKIEPGKQLVGLSIPNGEAARAFEQKLKAHDLAVKITYSGPNNEHWASDGSGIMSVSGGA
jgi:hypothetical protein